jgi:hypothetical protein
MNQQAMNQQAMNQQAAGGVVTKTKTPPLAKQRRDSLKR